MTNNDYIRMLSDYFLDIRKDVSSICSTLNKKACYITDNDLDLIRDRCIDIWNVMNNAEEEAREEEE